MTAGRRLLLIVLLGVAGATVATAQTPFALTGPGRDITIGSARDAGRGGWGVADRDTLAPGVLNPAALADLRHLLIFFSGFGERDHAEGSTGSRSTSRTFLPQARIAVPLSAGRLALQTGFDLRRSMQYRSRADALWIVEGDTLSGYTQVTREGTIFRVPVGLAWRPSDVVALGASLDFVRGPVTEELVDVVQAPAGQYLPNTLDQDDVIDGITGTFSALLTPPGPVSLGMTFSPGYAADLDRKISLGGVAQQEKLSYRLHLPAEYRAGLQVALGSMWRVGADGQLARWSTFRGLDSWSQIARDEWSLAVGVERPLQYLAVGHRHRLPLRAGLAWRRWAYEVGGHAVNERTYAVGTGFPFQNRLGRIDLALSYSVIGNQADNGWSSHTWRFSVSVSGLERLVF